MGALNVRTRTLFIQNSTAQMSLALASSWENQTGSLDWFHKELEKDIKNFQNSQEFGEQKLARGHVGSVPQGLEEVVEESLRRLREHKQVSKPYYIPSKKSFKVTKKDLTI